MKVHVLMFAAMREALGRDALELELPAGANAADAWPALRGMHPQLQAFPAPAMARNHAYVPGSTPLADGDELALIPPVAGG